MPRKPLPIHDNFAFDTFDASDDAFYVTVPGRNREEGYQFLRSVGAGGGLGTGSALSVDLQRLRLDYETGRQALARGVAERRDTGLRVEEIAAWVSSARAKLARSLRFRQGIGATVALEIRDTHKYGLGGRSFRNMWQRYGGKADKIIEGALRADEGVDEAVVKGARYLRYGGRVVIVLSVAASAYEIAHAKPADRTRVIYEQAGGALGGYLLAGAAAAVAVAAFGLVTGGWGLLAIGLLAGAAGGFAGTWAGDKIYYSTHPALQRVADTTGLVPAHMIHSRMEMAQPCNRGCHSTFSGFGGGSSGGAGASGSW